ncbi:MAG: hypothetical protein AAF597_00150 [Bacteroidota bacterium]
MEPVDFYHDCLERLQPGAPSEWPVIEAAYAPRPYHNLNHLREMLGHYAHIPESLQVASAREGINTSALFGLALIYHDLVYVAGRKDNEARSATKLIDDLGRIGTTDTVMVYVRRLIMATKSHQPSAEDAGAEALLIDLDLAVLARPAEGYADYAKSVRKEFWKYPNFLYKPGRRKALLHFLEQPRIYHTSYFHDKWELAARQNIARELESLM